MAGESGKRLLDGLLVADIGEDIVEHRQFRAALGRDVQPALGHHHQQADGFERDGLAAGVRAGDDNGARAGSQVDVDWRRRGRVEQRVAGLDTDG